MGRPIVSPALIAETFTYEPASGLLFWRVAPHGKVKAGDQCGRQQKQCGYPVLRFRQRHYMQHRVAWCLTHGRWPAQFIDHINGDRTDNRLVNLREADYFINSQNQRRARRDNRVGLQGVDFMNGSYRAALRIGGKDVHLGSFETATDAYEAYVAAKREHHPGCTL